MINEPLGLPKGSVRAMLILSIVIILGVSIFLNRDVISERCFDILAPLTTLYIGIKVKDTKGDEE